MDEYNDIRSLFQPTFGNNETMMKKLLLVALLIVLPLTIWAGKVTREQALKTAMVFMSGKSFKTVDYFTRSRGTSQNASDMPFYVFNAAEGGFVIVSGDDRAREILGYSPTDALDLDNLPANLRWWLDEYARQITALGTSTASVVEYFKC